MTRADARGDLPQAAVGDPAMRRKSRTFASNVALDAESDDGMYQMVQSAHALRTHHPHPGAGRVGVAPHHRHHGVAHLHADRATRRAARLRPAARGQLGADQAARADARGLDGDTPGTDARVHLADPADGPANDRTTPLEPVTGGTRNTLIIDVTGRGAGLFAALLGGAIRRTIRTENAAFQQAARQAADTTA